MAKPTHLRLALPDDRAKALLLLPDSATVELPAEILSLVQVVRINRHGCRLDGAGTDQSRDMPPGRNECAGWSLELAADCGESLGGTFENRPDPLRPELRILRSPHRDEIGRRIALLESVPSTIGRDPACTLVLEDKQVSRQHAKLVAKSTGHDIEDMGSTGGTHVGKERINRPERLRDGDEIRVGQTVLEYVALRESIVVRPGVSAALPLVGASSNGNAPDKIVQKAATNPRRLRSTDWLLIGTAAVMLLATVLLGLWLWFARASGQE